MEPNEGPCCKEPNESVDSDGKQGRGPCCFEYGRGKSTVRSSQWCYVELRFDLRDGDAFGFEEDLSDRGFELRLKFPLAESEVETYVSERVKQMNLGHTHKGTLVFTLPDLISLCPQGP